MEMTREEFYAKYGDVKVKFSRYYKYTFTYEGMLKNGDAIVVGYGGNSSDIYRHEVAEGHEETLSLLYPHEGAVYRDGKEIESFYDY